MLGTTLSPLCYSSEPITMISNEKKIVDFQPTSSLEPMMAFANVQSFKPKELDLSTIDQRNWSWKRFTVQGPYVFKGGDFIVLNTTYYKVMSLSNWQTSGFCIYDTVEDFQNNPNVFGVNINQKNGLAICDIIQHWFANSVENSPLFDGQIFLYNSNYTLPRVTTFFIIVKLVSSRSIAEQKKISLDEFREPIETISHPVHETYEINIISADGSSADAPLNAIKLGLQSNYSKNKQFKTGFRLGRIDEDRDESGIIGGTTCTKKVITVECQSYIEQTSKPVEYYTSAGIELLFEAQ